MTISELSEFIAEKFNTPNNIVIENNNHIINLPNGYKILINRKQCEDWFTYASLFVPYENSYASSYWTDKAILIANLIREFNNQPLLETDIELGTYYKPIFENL